jgi:hypothetical protein
MLRLGPKAPFSPVFLRSHREPTLEVSRDFEFIHVLVLAKRKIRGIPGAIVPSTDIDHAPKEFDPAGANRPLTSNENRIPHPQRRNLASSPCSRSRSMIA